MRSPEELVAAYVDAHNEGVRSGDFDALGVLLHPTASMRFRGLPAGPFESAAAILEALADQSPTDELVVSGVRRVDDGTAIATYAWSADPGRAAGRLEITARRGRISAIKVEAFS